MSHNQNPRLHPPPSPPLLPMINNDRLLSYKVRSLQIPPMIVRCPRSLLVLDEKLSLISSLKSVLAIFLMYLESHLPIVLKIFLTVPVAR